MSELLKAVVPCRDRPMLGAENLAKGSFAEGDAGFCFEPRAIDGKRARLGEPGMLRLRLVSASPFFTKHK